MKQLLEIDETASEQYLKAEAKLKHELPTHIQKETVPVTKLSFLGKNSLSILKSIIKY